MPIKRITKADALKALTEGTQEAKPVNVGDGWKAIGLTRSGARIEQRSLFQICPVMEYRLNGYAPNGSDLTL